MTKGETNTLVRIIAELGSASEVEIQAQTLLPLQELRTDLQELENNGWVRRLHRVFKGGYGDALELTPEGYKKVS